MKSIAVIGIGNLGLRHLESLYISKNKYKLYALDKYKSSLDNAQKHLNKIDNNQNNILYINSISQLPKKLDVIILSTNSDIRFELLNNLISNISFRYLIIEKIVFQKPENYIEIHNLLNYNNIICYINCPMRTYDFYKHIKNSNRNNELISMEVTGGNWDIGCNSIHYIDLYSYLSENLTLNYNFKFEKKLKKSKRKGFIEFNGQIFSTNNNSSLFLNCYDDNSEKKIIIEYQSSKYIIYENKGYYDIYINNKKNEKIDLNIPYQSQMTKNVVKDIFDNSCELPSYNSTFKIHQNFINSLLIYLNKNYNMNINFVPIT